MVFEILRTFLECRLYLLLMSWVGRPLVYSQPYRNHCEIPSHMGPDWRRDIYCTRDLCIVLVPFVAFREATGTRAPGREERQPGGIPTTTCAK